MISTEEADAVAVLQEQCQQILTDNLEMRRMIHDLQQQLEFAQYFGQKLCVLVDTQAHELEAEREKVKRLVEAITKAKNTYYALLAKQAGLYGQNGRLEIPIPRGCVDEFVAGQAAQNDLFALLAEMGE